MTDRREMVAAMEAVLFVATEPVSRQRLLDLFAGDEMEEAKAALEDLMERYAPSEDGKPAPRGVLLEEVAGGLRLITRPDVNDWLRRFFEAASSKKLSMGALETLAIVAYRQPVTSPEIQELRSVNPSGVLKTLLERRMVRIAGRKEVVGKPFLYATTQDFLVHFGLKSLKDLPPLEEFEEALAGEGLGELLGGTDFEEQALREAAEVEERAEEEEDRRREEEEEALQESSAEAEEALGGGAHLEEIDPAPEAGPAEGFEDPERTAEPAVEREEGAAP